MKGEQILLDIECQRDFFVAGGSCFDRRSSLIANRIYDLFRWAREQRLSVISTVLRVRSNEQGPLAEVPHCVEETGGEKKLTRTLLARRIDFGLRSTTDLPPDLFEHYQQVIFEKRHTDILRHARAERLFTEMPPATFVICGAGVTGGIVEAAVGLRSRGFGIILASDAVHDLGNPLAEMAYQRMYAKRVTFARTSEIVSRRRYREPAAFRRSFAPLG